MKSIDTANTSPNPFITTLTNTTITPRNTTLNTLPYPITFKPIILIDTTWSGTTNGNCNNIPIIEPSVND